MTIISYRLPGAQSSHLVNVDTLLTNGNYDELKQVHTGICSSITAYELEYANKLAEVEEKLYLRISQLNTSAKQTTGWRSVAFAISNALLGRQMTQIEKTHTAFSHAITQMRQRALAKEYHAEPDEIKALKSRRCENLDDELERLNSIPRINRSLEKVTENRKKIAKLNGLEKKHQVALGHSLELREELKETHYVINHGQNLDLMIANIVTRQLKQEFEPQQTASFEYLRHDAFLRHIDEKTHDVAWYKKQVSKHDAGDQDFRRELISGDCILESTRVNESAIDFFTLRTNIASRDSFIYSFVDTVLFRTIKDYIADNSIAMQFCRDLAKIFNKYPSGGSLYSICVPKEKFDESCYFSRPLGRPHPEQELLKSQLEEMQSGESSYNNVQVRVLSHKIRAEDGYHVVLNSTLTDNEILDIENEVHTCIQAALMGYRVQANPKAISLTHLTT